MGEVQAAAIALHAGAGLYGYPLAAGLAGEGHSLAPVKGVYHAVLGAGALANVKAGGGVIGAVVAVGVAGHAGGGAAAGGIELQVLCACVSVGAVGGEQLIPVAALAYDGAFLTPVQGAHDGVLGAGAAAHVQRGGGVVGVAAIRAYLEGDAAVAGVAVAGLILGIGEIVARYIGVAVAAPLYLIPSVVYAPGSHHHVVLLKPADDVIAGAGAAADIHRIGGVHSGLCGSDRSKAKHERRYQQDRKDLRNVSFHFIHTSR